MLIFRVALALALAEKKKREAADSSKETLLERRESREQHHKNFRAFMLEQKKVRQTQSHAPSLSPFSVLVDHLPHHPPHHYRCRCCAL